MPCTLKWDRCVNSLPELSCPHADFDFDIDLLEQRPWYSKKWWMPDLVPDAWWFMSHVSCPCLNVHGSWPRKVRGLAHACALRDVASPRPGPRAPSLGICWRDCFDLLSNVYGKSMEIICLKALGNYYGPFWSYNFSICLWDNLKLLISMISGVLNVSPAPNTNYFYLLTHQDT